MTLAKSAMLVSVNIVNGGLLGERRDATASHLVQNTYGTADRRTKASKYLIDRKHKSVKRVVAASQRVREVVYRYTMPWGDDKARLLAVRVRDQFAYDLERAIKDLNEAREDYVQEYPALVFASEKDLGPLFDRSQYPDPDKVRALFSTKANYWPMPESNHFIAEISQEAAQEAKEAIEGEIEQRLLEATYDMVRRAKEVVVAFVDKLEAFRVGTDGKPETIFRDSLIQNIADTANLVDRMNITGNAQIKKVVKDLQRIMLVAKPYHLRKPEAIAYREKALSAGKEVLMNLTMLDLKDQEVTDMVADAGDYMDM